MSRIFVCGDTHAGAIGDLEKLASKKFPEGKELTKNDYVIVLGDFGFLWSNIPSKREKYHYKWFDEKPFTTLFVDGNHENFARLDALPTEIKFNNPVGKVNDSIYHLRRGYVYNIGGRSIFAFGGGFSIDKASRREDISWWSREMPNKEEYDRGLESLKSVDNKVDYILTHTCSNRMFSELAIEADMFHKIEGEEQIRDFFDIVDETVERKHWYYGHFHYDHVFENHTQMYDKVKELK